MGSTKKPTYLERAFLSFFKEKFFGGLQAMRAKTIWPFSAIGLGTLLVTIALMGMNFQDEARPYEELIAQFLTFSSLSAMALVVFGLASAAWKQPVFQVVLGLAGVGLAAYLSFLTDIGESWSGVAVIRLVFLVVWILNSTISMLFLLIYLFTGIGGKLICAGKSDDHTFLGGLCSLLVLATAGLSAYLMVMDRNFNAWLIGGLGITFAVAYLALVVTLKKDGTTTNFLTIVGLYNILLVYRLTGAVAPAEDLPNIVTELAITTFVALYTIQNMANRVSLIDTAQLEAQKRKMRSVFFQARLNVFPRIKSIFGDHALILLALGLTFGYFTIVVKGFVDPSYPILDQFIDSTLGLNVISHRLHLLASLVLLLAVMVIFKTSEHFRQFVTNKYNVKQAAKIAGDVVKSLGKRLKRRFGKGPDQGTSSNDDDDDLDALGA
jgi:hypothetical protein